MTERNPQYVVFRREGRLVNYSGTPFEFRLERTIRLLARDAAARELALPVPAELKLVAFESENALDNTGTKAWTKQSGPALDLDPGDVPAVAAHERGDSASGEGSESAPGRSSTTPTSARCPAIACVVRDGRLLLQRRRQAPQQDRPLARARDGRPRQLRRREQVLTIVQLHAARRAPPTTSTRCGRTRRIPTRGDVVNSYNDGPPAPGGKPLGPFYELETSSPAAELEPGGRLTHVHRTFHFQGARAGLDALARELLGVTLDEVEAFSSR